MVRGEAEEEEELEEEPLWDAEAMGEAPLPRNLERHLHRRAVAIPPKRRKVTLNELIQQLEAMASVMAEHTPRTRIHRPRAQPTAASRASYCPACSPGKPVGNCRSPGSLFLTNIGMS
jgi:segregation and condensation protein A